MPSNVVITGLGPICAAGVGIDPLWRVMTGGRTTIDRIRRFDPSGFPCQIAAELDDDVFRIRDIVPKTYRKATKVMCRDIELAVVGADAALRHAGIVTRAIDPDATPTVAPSRFGCHIGAGLIAADIDELTGALVTSRTDDGFFDIHHWGEQGMNNLTPLWLLKYLPNMLACHVTIVHDCQGPSNTITCGEASGLLSLGESMRVIERGAADACLTGGAEFKLNPVAFFRQHCAKRLAPAGKQTDPASVVRPFADDAVGTVLGEGGGLVVIERGDSARERGATIHAEIVGYSATQSPSLHGRRLEPDPADPAVRDLYDIAIRNAGLTPDDIDAVVPFGSGIPSSDRVEADAIRATFGERATSIPIMTTVPFVGNCNAGNGVIALCVAAQALRTQTLPARLHPTSTDLNANAAESRSADLHHILVSSTSQGGQNAAVILRRSA